MAQFLILNGIETNPVINFIDDCLRRFQGCPDYVGYDMFSNCILFPLKTFRLLIRERYGLLPAVMGYSFFPFLDEKSDFILCFAYPYDLEFREPAGTLVDYNNTGRA